MCVCVCAHTCDKLSQLTLRRTPKLYEHNRTAAAEKRGKGSKNYDIVQ